MLQRGFSLSCLPNNHNNINVQSEDLSPRHQTLPSSFNSNQNHLHQVKNSSRYEEDFCELEKVGKGGYGSVYRVKNKLDGEYYALKKIPFKNTTKTFLEKVLREVKTLASLNHRNIVRYHSAWLETEEIISTSVSNSLASSINGVGSNNNGNNKFEELKSTIQNNNLLFEGNWGTTSEAYLSESHSSNQRVKKSSKKKRSNLLLKKKLNQKKNNNHDSDSDDPDNSLYRLQFPPELEEDLKNFSKQASIRESMCAGSGTNDSTTIDDSEDSAVSGGTGFFKTPKKHYTNFNLDDEDSGAGAGEDNLSIINNNRLYIGRKKNNISSDESDDYSDQDDSEDNSTQDDSDYSNNDSDDYTSGESDEESDEESDNIFERDFNNLIPNPKVIPTSTTPPISMPSPNNLRNGANNGLINNINNNNKLKVNFQSSSLSPSSTKINKITTLYIVMQLYSQTLSQWLENRPPDQVNEDENLNIFKQICIGLRYIHSKGIIHRDLKPGNVFLVRAEDQQSFNVSSSFEENPEGGGLLVSLGDFGLAVQHTIVTTPSPTPTSTPSLTPVNTNMLLSNITPIEQILTINQQLSNNNNINNNNNNNNNSYNNSNPLNNSNSSTTTNSLSSSSSTILTPPTLSVQQQQQPSPQTNLPQPSSSLSSSSTTPSVSTGTSLSRSLEHCKHTSAVGTLTYSSPEQKKGLYNEKTDIYSLGIILFELYFPLSTRMEKARVLTDLRNGVLPKSFAQKYPKVADLILQMMKLNPDERPSASDILKSEIFGQVLSIPEYESIIKQQQSLIEQLKQEIYQLKSPSVTSQPTSTNNSLNNSLNNTNNINNNSSNNNVNNSDINCINPPQLVESSFINSTRSIFY